MDRRCWTGLLTACALLVQTLGAAWAAPVLPAAHDANPAASSMACHPDTGALPVDDAAFECCGDHESCSCAAVCGGAFAPAVTPAPLRNKARAQLAPARPVPAAAPAHRLSLLRPPITSQR